MIKSDQKLIEYQNLLRKKRKEKGVSQTKLAKLIGVSQPHLSHIEDGSRRLTPERYSLISEILDD